LIASFIIRSYPARPSISIFIQLYLTFMVACRSCTLHDLSLNFSLGRKTQTFLLLTKTDSSQQQQQATSINYLLSIDNTMQRTRSPLTILICMLATALPFGTTLVDAAAMIDPLVLCDETILMGGSKQQQQQQQPCATRTYISPSIGPNGTYVGGYSTTFHFTSGLANGTIHMQGDTNSHDNGLLTRVKWDNNHSMCEADVDNTTCTSCTLCNETAGTFSVDCRNLPFGIATLCQPILPVFYPLNASFPYPVSTISSGGGGGGGGSITRNTESPSTAPLNHPSSPPPTTADPKENLTSGCLESFLQTKLLTQSVGVAVGFVLILTA